MAYSLNRAQIIGNLTRDPEVRAAGSQKVATFGVATSFAWTDQSGVKKEKTEFHNVVAWRGLAEICEKYLRKGHKVYIEGRLQTRDWEGEDGVKRYKTEIVADNMIMLSKKSDSAPSSVDYGGQADSSFESAPARQQKSLKSSAKSAEKEEKPQEEEVSIDDLPF